MLRNSYLLFLSLFVIVSASVDPPSQLERDEIIEAVNNAKTTWKAGRNFHETFTKSYVKNLLGLKQRPGGNRLPPLPDSDEDDELVLPKSFDARDKWSGSTSLKDIRDQGPCGSCWAVSAASAFSDRLYIASNGDFNSLLSAEDLLTCCSECGYGCDGGYDDEAWNYFLNTGICTGGDYKSKEGCQPYKLPTCEHHVPGPRKNCSAYGDLPTPKCLDTCYNKQYKVHSKDQDLHKVKKVHSISKKIKQIQKEIFQHGPVQAGFDVYEDFLSYKSGVYHHIKGDLLGGHAVKVIGWGNEDGTDYWLVANSWNSDWGDSGYFKIRRGKDECGFESDISFGYPDL